MMRRHQRGISLVLVAVLMAGLAALAMAAIFSIRHERNLLEEGWDKLAGPKPPLLSPAAAGKATETVSSAPLRKCVIDGRTVVSNTECGTRGQQIVLRDSRGIEAPRVPTAVPTAAPSVPPAESGDTSLRDKMLQKAMP